MNSLILSALFEELAFNTKRQLQLKRRLVLALTIPYGSGSASVGRRLASAWGLVLGLVESANSVGYSSQGSQGFRSKSEQRTAIY
jgi:hypothetical protein